MRIPVTLLISALPFFLSVLAHPEKQNLRSTGFAVPISKRDEVRSPGGAVNLRRLKDSTRWRVNVILDGLSNFERNTGTRHPLAKSSLRSWKRATGNVPLVSDIDSGYWYGTAHFGTPPVALTMDFDTGSSGTIIPSKKCGSSCDGHTRYDPSASETAVDLNIPFKSSFGNGNSTVSGEVYNDTVSVAGLTAYHQTLGVALTYSTEFEAKTGFSPDGIMGLAYRELSYLNVTPFFETLVAQNRVTYPEFAFKLAENGSELFLGGVNRELYRGHFTYVPVVKKGYWQTLLDGVSINDCYVPLSEKNAIIDTGTTLIIGNKHDVVGIYSQIPGSGPVDPKYDFGEGFFTIPCNTTTVVSFVFGDKAFPVSPSIFNIGLLFNGSDTCVGGVIYSTAISENIHSWIVGDVFLRNVYAVYDMGVNRIGFADLA